METGVKAGNLRQIGLPLCDGADGCQIAGLVQRRKRGERIQLLQDIIRDPHGAIEMLPAVDNAVTDALYGIIAEMHLDPWQEQCDDACLVDGRIEIGKGAGLQCIARRITRRKSRIAADTGYFAGDQRGRVCVVHRIDRKFHAR